MSKKINKAKFDSLNIKERIRTNLALKKTVGRSLYSKIITTAEIKFMQT